MPTLDKKPVSVSAVRAAAALTTENAHRVEPALITVASPPETPQSSSATEAAVMARIQSIMAAAGEGQERLCIELITQGKSELEAVKALNADLKAKNAELESRLLLKEAELPAEPKKPEVSKEEVVAELLKRYQAAAPQIPAPQARASLMFMRNSNP